MTLVTIDLGDVAGGHHPDDHVIIRAEAFRESPGGGVTSTAEVVIPLVDGVGQAEVEPGPVVVAFRCRAVADTREKRGVVPESGPVGVEDVIAGAFEYTPPVVNRGLDLIEDARDEALGQVAGAVSAEVESIRWWRGYLDADAVITTLPQGMYGVGTSSLATALGLPIASTGWLMVHWELPSGLARRVDYHAHPGSIPVIYTMRLVGETWTSWEISSHRAPALGSGADLDDAQVPARYAVISTGVANLPSQRPGSMDVAVSTGAVIQTFTDLDLDVYVRRTLTSGWTPWEQLNAVVDPTVPDDVAQARAEAIAAIIAAQSEALEAIRDAPGGGGGFVDRGEWSTSEDYVIGDVVTHDGGRWVGQAHTETQVRKNYVRNPGIVPSPQGAPRPGWPTSSYISTSEATPGRVEMTITQDLDGDAVLLTNSGRTPTTPGEVASAAVVVSVPADSPAVTVNLRILYYSSPPGGTVETIQPGQSKRLILEESVTPANRAEMSLHLSLMGPVAAGSKIVVSEPILEKAPTIGNYFDGDSPDSDNGSAVTHEWEGDPWEGGATQTRSTTADPTGAPGVDPAWILLGGTGAGGGNIDADALEQLRAASAAVEATREYVDTRMGELDVAFTDSVPTYLQQSSLDAAYGGRAEESLPLGEVTITPRGSGPIPTEFFDGFIWGVEGDIIRQSSDGGQSWLTVGQATGIGNIQRILKCGDGELLVVSTVAAWRSVGWGTESVSWQVVLENPTPSFFYPWGVSGDGTKFIIVHYSGSGVATPDRADSRYGWISTDAGQTWNIVWDVVEQWDEDVNHRTHIHAAEYDPWEDRFFIAEGHEEVTGVYVSYDDGDTWDKITYGPSFDNPPGNSPTVIKATDHGIVFGSDDPTNGVMVMPRGTHEIQRAYSRRGVSNTILMGYAHMGARDPRTGQVYLVWELNSANAGDIGAQIMASDGLVAGPVWEDTDPGRYLWRRIVIDGQGTLLAWEQGTNSILRATIPGIGVIPGHMHDTGRVMGGKVTGGRGAVAVGPESRAEGNNTVAIGGGRTSGHGGVAIGSASVINNGVAIGQSATAAANGMAVGGDAFTVNGFSAGMGAASHHATSTAFGREAEARVAEGTANTSSTAVGWRAKATASAGGVTAVGAEAKAPNNRSTALGAGASAEGSTNGTAVGQGASVTAATNGTAVGQGTTVAHGNSVALGQASATTSTYQVHVGPRHIEALPPEAAPTAPAAGARVYTRVVDEKTELVAQFPTGDPVVIAQEP